MRGTQLVQFHPSEPRLIPAGAGNTERFQRRSVGPSVYPRWRGEHDDVTVAGVVTHGLSPLARGTLVWQPGKMALLRFIPAGAGNTLCAECANDDGAVYPRWRGEHLAGMGVDGNLYGLSPLARGTRQRNAATLPRSRFIPAGAGNTLRSARCGSGRSVYPRWRGEHARI